MKTFNARQLHSLKWNDFSSGRVQIVYEEKGTYHSETIPIGKTCKTCNLEQCKLMSFTDLRRNGLMKLKALVDSGVVIGIVPNGSDCRALRGVFGDNVPTEMIAKKKGLFFKK